ncbi:MAG TPA: Gfo/Idh/MocA family oxidoreductase [Candidatus Polarisedimenticolia bacterium]|nr:Gfo/Idh/MocA family oxidoreductase [Candidatus Polarisedimenticolia bacterium]
MGLRDGRDKVGYAVVGEGYIAQAAVLPAFAHARRNSRLAALVSGDREKLRTLGRRYGVTRLYSYDEYDECLAGGEVDAVYIALPNDMHREYSVRAAHAGIHVLCEKPMAVTEQDCLAMIEAAERNRVKLMVAYRLHFDPANLAAVEAAQSGRLGDLRLFTSTFTMQVEEGNIRLLRARGGGTLYDIGIYCINAARYLFQDEPVEALARTVAGAEGRFREVEEAASAILRFPGGRVASFTCSFGSSDVSAYRLCGTKGDLLAEPAYEYAEDLVLRIRAGGRTRRRTFARHDQFAPELLHLSDCILKGTEPEPSGREGLVDVQIIEALYRSAREGRPVPLTLPSRGRRPGPGQAISRPPVEKPRMVKAKSPSGRE